MLYRQGSARIWVCLDLVYANSNWLNMFGSSVVKHLPRANSDHCPILLSITSQRMHSCRLFKFHCFWIEYNKVRDVQHVWNVDSCSGVRCRSFRVI